MWIALVPLSAASGATCETRPALRSISRADQLVAPAAGLHVAAIPAEGLKSGGLTRAFNTVVAAVMTAGSFAMFAPILYNILSTKSGLGLSQVTWLLNLVGVSGILAYNIERGIRLSNYVENIFIALQSLMINALLLYYNGLPAELAIGAAVAFGAAFALAVAYLPATVFPALQAAATVTYSWALVPQIVRNFAQRSAGGWSPITAFLATSGNAVRVATTLSVARHETVLLAQFVLGLLLNGCLLLQILVWG